MTKLIRRNYNVASGFGVLIALLALFSLAIKPSVTVATESTAKPVQSMLLRSVTVTYDLQRSLLFYRDILNQSIIEDVPLDAARSVSWLDVSPQAKIRFVVLLGRAEYAGGPILGGRKAFIGIDDPAHAGKEFRRANRRGTHGDTILPHRVQNLDEIVRRLKAERFEFLFEPRVSPTGLSRNCMVFDGDGQIVELFEIIAVK